LTASFFKELLRKATLAALDDGRGDVAGADVDRALDELLHENAALTRVLLGGGGGEATTNDAAHAWLRDEGPGPHGGAQQVVFRPQGP
jgi:hypothetical protein